MGVSERYEAMAIKQSEPQTKDLELTDVLYALSDATRLQIVLKLTTTSEIPCGDFDIDMPKSSLSHHFRILRTSGVIASRKEGTALQNRLRKDDLEKRFPGLLKSILSAVKR
jgi:DNA-binding transcriptional ArsR family regulator